MRLIEAAGPLAWWRVPLAVAGFAALVMAAAFLTHVEKRYPLVYYKSRRFQARFCGILPALLRHYMRSVFPLDGARGIYKGWRFFRHGLSRLIISGFARQAAGGWPWLGHATASLQQPAIARHAWTAGIRHCLCVEAMLAGGRAAGGADLG